MGKGRRWVYDLLRWDASADASPFSDPKNPRKGGGTSAAKQVLTDPEQRAKVR